MTGMRRPEEVAVVVRRPGAAEDEYLVLLRSAEKHGYWHIVAGGVEWGEAPVAAAARELAEETGVSAEPVALGGPLVYELAGDPESVRKRFAPGTTTIVVWPFVAEVPRGWEPALNHEHVEHRWVDADGAAALLHYPEPREAVRRAAGS